MRKFSTLLILFASLTVLSGLTAQDQEQPEERLRKTVDAVLNVIYGPDASSTSLTEKEDRIREIIESNFNVTIMVRRAMGRNWTRLTEPQQERVRFLIGELVVRIFVKRMRENPERPEIVYLKTKKFGPNRLEVPTRITTGGETFNVTYRFGLLEEGWEIYDLLAEGVSVIGNYRKQFDEHFTNGDGEGLIVKLEELLEKESQDLNL